MKALLDDLAAGLANDRGPEDAAAWLQRSKAGEHQARLARDTARRAQEETGFNARWWLWRARYRPLRPSRYESAIEALHDAADQIQRMCESVVWLDRDESSQRPPANPRVVSVLCELSAVTAEYQSTIGRADDGIEPRIQRLLERCRDEYSAMAAGFQSDDTPDPTRWIAELTLLAAAERAAQSLIDHMTSPPLL